MVYDTLLWQEPVIFTHKASSPSFLNRGIYVLTLDGVLLHIRHTGHIHFFVGKNRICLCSRMIFELKVLGSKICNSSSKKAQ